MAFPTSTPSLISGESVPGAARPGDKVFAGTLNLTAPLRLDVTAVGEGTLLAEIVRLMEMAEQGQGALRGACGPGVAGLCRRWSI